MTEIKSTLDLILEKTKHLTLSEEEKAELRLKEINGKIMGWIQKYRDTTIKLDSLRSELDLAEKEYGPGNVKNLLKKVLVRSVEPEQDNTPLFDLLEQLIEENTDILYRLLDTFYRKCDEGKRRLADKINHALVEKGISGSAIVPNPDKDEEWKLLHATLLEAFTKQRDLIADN